MLGEDGPNGKLRYFYDANGICGFSRTTGTYTGNYVYVKDVLGNIVMLKNVTGAIVAKYSYDEWGNHIVMDANGNEHASAGFIGNINPFRYRGYYYDTESKLYYLMSRYYDPEIGQFISMDSVDYLAPDEIGGVDLYAYCRNNPIMYVDPTGHVVLVLLAGLIITGVVAELMAESYYNSGKPQEIYEQYNAQGVSIVGGQVTNSYLVTNPLDIWAICVYIKYNPDESVQKVTGTVYGLFAEWIIHDKQWICIYKKNNNVPLFKTGCSNKTKYKRIQIIYSERNAVILRQYVESGVKNAKLN